MEQRRPWESGCRGGEENGFDGGERGRQVFCLEESGDLKKTVEEMGLVGWLDAMRKMESDMARDVDKKKGFGDEERRRWVCCLE